MAASTFSEEELKKKIKPDFVKKFFPRLLTLNVLCKVCKVNVKTSNNRTNIKTHVIKHHADLCTMFLDSKKTAATWDLPIPPGTCEEAQDAASSSCSSSAAKNSHGISSKKAKKPTSFSDDEDDPEVIEESVEPQAGGSKRKLDDHFPTKTTKRIRVATKQISIEEALKNVNSISIDVDNEKTTKTLLRYLVKTGTPIPSLTHKDLHELLTGLVSRGSRHSVPSVQELVEMKNESVQKMKQFAKNFLKDKKFTVDIRIQKTYKEFLVLGIFFVVLDTTNGAPKFFSPCVDLQIWSSEKDLDQSVLKAKFEAACRKFDVSSNNIMCVICDNDIVNLAIKSAITSKDIPYIPNFFTTLDSFKMSITVNSSVRSLLEKIKELQDYFNHDFNNAMELQVKCAEYDQHIAGREKNEEDEEETEDALAEVCSRFLSTNEAELQICDFSKLQPVLAQLFIRDDFLDCPQFTNVEIRVSYELGEIFEVLSATEELASGDPNFNLSQCVPLLAMLDSTLESQYCKTAEVKSVVKQLRSDVKKFEKNLSSLRIVLVSQLFDTRVKGSFVDDLVESRLMTELIEELKELVKSSPSENSSLSYANPGAKDLKQKKKPKGKLEEAREHFLNKRKQAVLSEEESAERDLRNFARKQADSQRDPIQFWLSMKTANKHVAQLALKYLSVPGCSQQKSILKLSHSTLNWKNSQENWSSVFLASMADYLFHE